MSHTHFPMVYDQILSIQVAIRWELGVYGVYIYIYRYIYHMFRQTRGQIGESQHFPLILVLSVHFHMHNRNLQHFSFFLNRFEPEMFSIDITFLDVCLPLSSAINDITWGIPHIDQDHLNFIMTSDVFDHAGCLDSKDTARDISDIS